MSGVFVKTPVFPFVRFPGVDTILGPEMKSTGEVMGGARDVRHRRSPRRSSAPASSCRIEGTAFISVNNHDKPASCRSRATWRSSGFKLVATRGTAAYLRAHGLDVDIVFKVNEGRPHVGDEILNGEIAARHQHAARPRVVLRRPRRPARAMMQGVPCITTLTGAAAAVSAIRALRDRGPDVRSLQEYHAGDDATPDA